jgi:predicted secreted Zn-dependent protease
MRIEGILFFIAIILLLWWVTKAKLIFGNEAINSFRYSYFTLDEKTKEYLDKYYKEEAAKQKAQ